MLLHYIGRQVAGTSHLPFCMLKGKQKTEDDQGIDYIFHIIPFMGLDHVVN